jgi:hypothetical protein
MKIQSIDKVVEQIVYYVTTDEEDYCDYRRYGDSYWEVAMGESWETVYIKEKELEALFQEFLGKQ